VKGDMHARRLIDALRKLAKPADVAEVDPNEIAVDPARFQFKLRTDAKTGVGAELAGVDTFNPELAGVLAVWDDPADGKTYVVNGHHRLELARRSGAKSVLVRRLKAATAEEARAKGALINIAEGRGTAVDAAKFLRDTGTTVEDLRRVGVSVSGAVARDAVLLAKLDGSIFHKVSLGIADLPQALAVAAHLPDHEDQARLMDYVGRTEKKTNKPVPPATVAELAKEMAAAPRGKVADAGGGGLFEGLGGGEEESLFFQRAELKSFVRQALSARAKNFGLLGSARRAAVVTTGAGNVVDPAANRVVADEAKGTLGQFDQMANRTGAISAAIDAAAAEYAAAKTESERTRIRSKLLDTVTSQLSARLL
jgi:hypothetical protein